MRLLMKGMKCPVGAGVMYVAPTQGMARVLMWDLLHQLGGPLIASSNVNNSEIRLINGITLYVRGADSPDSLRGMALYDVVMDEFKDMKPQVWELIIRPALSDYKGTALFIGTPEPGESLFRQYYERGVEGSDPEWASFHFTTLDNELIDPKEIEAARRSMSTMAFKQEYEASFDCMGADVFKEEWFRYGPEPREGDWYIAVDLAGFSDVVGMSEAQKKSLDDTAIAVVKVTPDGKWWVKKVDMFRKDVRETAVRILMAIRTYKPICVGIEKGSLQRAVMPYLQDLMNKNAVWSHIEEIPTSGSSKKGSDAIANRVIYALQGLFEHGRITFSENENHQKLKEQILVFPSKRAHDDGCFPAEAPVITADGVKPIVEVTKNDLVLTRNGFKRVLRAWCRGTKPVITRFGITATPDHKVFTGTRGWVRLDSLCMSDMILMAYTVEETSCEKPLNSTAESTTDTQTQRSQTTGNTSPLTPGGKKLRESCIETSGSSTTGQYLTDTISIISTETSATTTSQTSNACLPPPIKWSILKRPAGEAEVLNNLLTLNESGIEQKHGTPRQKAGSGIGNTPCDPSEKNCRKNHASYAEQCSDQRYRGDRCAAKNVKGREGTNFKESHGVPVYDLTVEGGHEFFAYGRLVHNCDALSLVAHLVTVIYGKPDDMTDEVEVLDDVVGF